MNTAIAKLDLLENCKDREYREALNEENVYAVVCAQLRALREQRGLSQKQFGRLIHMAQERVSILEDPNAETKPTLNTLLRLAAGLDVGLDVRFVPFSTVLDRSTRTEESLLKVDSFDDEVEDLEREMLLARAEYAVIGKGVVQSIDRVRGTPERSTATEFQTGLGQSKKKPPTSAECREFQVGMGAWT